MSTYDELNRLFAERRLLSPDLAELATATDPQDIADRYRPKMEFMFAELRVGFEGCDDEDARISLAMIDALESFTLFTYNNPASSTAPAISRIIGLWAENSSEVIRALRSVSELRAGALGREMPTLSDFQPDTSVGNSGVAEDPNKVDTPAFIHPPNGRAV